MITVLIPEGMLIGADLKQELWIEKVIGLPDEDEALIQSLGQVIISQSIPDIAKHSSYEDRCSDASIFKKVTHSPLKGRRKSWSKHIRAVG